LTKLNKGGFVMKLVCPECGSTNIDVITNDDENLRYMCKACSTTGNRELFSASEDNDNGNKNKEFWT